MRTLADFKRELHPGSVLTRTFLENDQIVAIEKRSVISVNTVGFTTSGLSSVSYMPFGPAKEWEFDNYIAGWAALWTDPENPAYQTQYKYVEDGFEGI